MFTPRAFPEKWLDTARPDLTSLQSFPDTKGHRTSKTTHAQDSPLASLVSLPQTAPADLCTVGTLCVFKSC